MPTRPVCRIMDYNRFKYESAQRAKESRKKATSTSIKEMKYRPKIGIGRLHDEDPPGGPLSRGRPQGKGHDHVPWP